MKIVDLITLTLAGPIRQKPVLNPTAVHLLENRLYINDNSQAMSFDLLVL